MRAGVRAGVRMCVRAPAYVRTYACGSERARAVEAAAPAFETREAPFVHKRRKACAADDCAHQHFKLKVGRTHTARTRPHAQRPHAHSPPAHRPHARTHVYRLPARMRTRAQVAPKATELGLARPPSAPSAAPRAPSALSAAPRAPSVPHPRAPSVPHTRTHCSARTDSGAAHCDARTHTHTRRTHARTARLPQRSSFDSGTAQRALTYTHTHTRARARTGLCAAACAVEL